jgi:hypothetical protein
VQFLAFMGGGMRRSRGQIQRYSEEEEEVGDKKNAIEPEEIEKTKSGKMRKNKMNSRVIFLLSLRLLE